MRHVYLAGLVACWCAPGWAAEPARWAPYVEASAWEAYDGIPIRQFEKDWSVGYAPKAGRNVMFQRNRIEAGLEYGAWRLAWEYRQEAVLSTDDATMELIRLYKQRVKLSAPASFDVEARLQAWSAQGLRLSRWFEAPAAGAARVNLALALYGTPRVRDNTVTGKAEGGPDQPYSFQVAQTDANSRYSYPFMHNSFGGSGASVSLALDWPLSATSVFKLKLDDLWSRMRWRNLPQTVQTANSAVAQYDAQGYINYRPLLSGQNSQIDQNATIRRSGAATLATRWDAWGAALEVQRYAGVTIPTFTGSRQFDWGGLSASVETRFKTVGLAYQRGDFHIGLQTDKLNLNLAKAVGLNLGYRHPF
ncbi:hypothetical protein AAKU55_004542 [Oxalobacteraceae bacterium GrIS 1.11]